MIAAAKFVELVVAVVTFVTRLCVINAELTKQLADLRRKRPKSETLARLERQLLLPHPEFGVIVRPPRKKSNDKDGNEKKKPSGKGGGRGRAADYLERVEVENRVPPTERICPVCGTEMKTVGHSRCEIIDVVAAKVFVQVRLDERVACPKDDAIVSAKAPPAIVERGKLSDRLLVEALADKYLEHMPIERQCSRYERYGVTISPSTLGRGVCAAIDLLAPVARLIQTQTRGPGLLGTDATLIR
jgi:transposase